VKNNDKLIKNILVHIKYPYTAIIISIMWISIALIIVKQGVENLEILIGLTSLCTLIIAAIGFKTPK